VQTDPQCCGEDLIGEARDRAQRVADDLARDADDLRTSSSARPIAPDDHRQLEALLNDARRAATRLHDVLNQPLKQPGPE